MTPADMRIVKTSSHSLSHKDNISNYFTCFQCNPVLLQPKHCLASVSANGVINIHIFTEMRWETHWRAHIHTHKRNIRTPQREISWLLKYNYLTAGCHLGRCLDRLFFVYHPLCLSVSSLYFSWLQFSPSLTVFSVSLFSHPSVLSETFAWRIQLCWFDSSNKCFVDIIFHINSPLKLNWMMW